MLLRRLAHVIPRPYQIRTYSKGTTVGFIGVGNMGGHMASNLIKAGHSVIIHDKDTSAVDKLVAMGAKKADNPAAIAMETTTIVTMLPSSPHVLDVYKGAKGIMSTMQNNTLLIDSSTIDPAVSREIAAIVTDKNSDYLDAPVSGGVAKARDAQLTFIVGGSEDGFSRAKPLLDDMGANVIHCGGSGCGQAVKICNNMMLAVAMIGTAETINLGIKLGLDPKLLTDVLNVSTGRTFCSELYNPCPGIGPLATNGYQGGFGTKLMAKDLGLAQDAATALKQPTPLGSLAHQIYRIMSQQEYADLDFSSVFKFIQSSDNQ
ncbi:3-hydroxyisobutyrate dehydrogenase, mitochondrial-like isoform X2 [Dysidea avara]